MEQLENTSYDNGNIISEDEANDIYYISSLKKQYGSMSMPQVDNFDVSGNKEPTLGETIKEGVSAVGTAINEQQGTLDNIGEDTTKGMIKGADKGITQTLKGVANLAGQPVDMVNEYAVKPALEYLGIEGSDDPFMGTKMTTGLMDSFISMTNKVFPKLISDPINESLNEPFNNETYGKLVEGISQFGITAVPAAKLVSMMSSANPFVRGMAWGGIADYMSMNPEDPTATEMLLTWWQGADPKERSDWANNAIAVVQKNDTDGEATKRLKNMLDGALIGGSAEGLIQGILKASTIVPWKQLLKTVTPAAAGGVTFSDDAEGSVFTPLVKAAAKEVLPNTVAKNADNVMQVDSLKPSNNQAGKDFDAANARYFEEGNYQAPTAENPISIIKPTEEKPGIIAFHGSGADFDEFKLSQIGTGEGAQVFGYGFYFTDSKTIAKFYKDSTRKRENVLYKNKPIKYFDFDDAFTETQGQDLILGMIRDRISGKGINAKEAIRTVEYEYEQVLDNNPYKNKNMINTNNTESSNAIDKYNYEETLKNINYIKSLKPEDFDYNLGKTYEVKISAVINDLIDNDIPLNQQSRTMQNNAQKLINILPFEENKFFKLDLNLSGGGFRQELENQVRAGINKIADNNVKRLKNEMSQLDFERMINEDPFLKLVNSKMLDDKTVTGYIGNPQGSTPKIASEIMNEFGIKGIKYKAGQLSAKESDATNYVIFDDKIIDVMKKYGIVGAVGVTAANSNDADASVFSAAIKAATKESPSIVKKKSLNNVSNLTRAKKLGFDVDNPVYHGTNANELTEFKEGTIGSATDQGFFGKGFYFASNPGEAGYYGKNVGKYVVRGKLLDLNNKSGDYTLGGVVKFVDWAEKLDKIDMLDVDTKAGLKGAKKLIKYFNENIEYKIGQNADGTDGVFATIVNPTRKVDVYKGKEYPVTIDSIVNARGNFPKTKEEAREQLLNNFAYDMRQSNYKDIDFFKGWNNDFYDSLSDYIREGGKGSAELTKKAKAAGYDGIKAADETVIFDPKNIRSIDAKFDPAKTNSPDLMSSYSKQNNSQMS